MTNSGWMALGFKALGAVAGAAISMTIWVPRSFWEGVRRAVVSIVTAIVLAPVLSAYASSQYDWATRGEIELGAFFLVACFAWPVLGKAGLAIENYRSQRKDG